MLFCLCEVFHERLLGESAINWGFSFGWCFFDFGRIKTIRSYLFLNGWRWREFWKIQIN